MLFSQSGGSDGVRAHVYLNLESKDKYVLLSNYEGIPFRKILIDIEQIIQGEAVEIPQEKNRKEIPLKNSILKAYEGVYKFDDMNGLLLTFKSDGTGLIVYQEGEEIARLKAESESIFFEKPSDDDVFEFVSNETAEDIVLMGWKGVKFKGSKAAMSHVILLNRRYAVCDSL